MIYVERVDVIEVEVIEVDVIEKEFEVSLVVVLNKRWGLVFYLLLV